MRFFAISAISFIFAFSVSAGAPFQASAQDASDSEVGTGLTPLEVAKIYGLDGWDAVEELRYTFNMKLGRRVTSRQWTWRPREDLVTYEGTNAEGELVAKTYSRGDLPANPEGLVGQIDRWFINDSYWLLFPLHLVWDDGVTITNEGRAAAPISGEPSTQMTVQYGDEGGYTPGDRYHLFLGEDGVIREWSVKPAAWTSPAACTWEENQQIGPLKISTKHRDENGIFDLWFSDVKVTTIGGVSAEGGWSPSAENSPSPVAASSDAE